jgi:hypothetical protein
VGFPVIAPNPRSQVELTAQGVLAENYPVVVANSTGAFATQVVNGFTVGLRAGDVVTGITLRLAVAASGTAPTLARFGLAGPDAKIVALSADQGAAANWVQGPCRFPLTTPYTVQAEGGYYPCLLVNGTWSVTQPTSARLTAGSQFTMIALAGFVAPSFQWAGQTDLPAIGAALTITAGGGSSYYMGVY